MAWQEIALLFSRMDVREWRYLDSNQGPRAYESLALTN